MSDGIVLVRYIFNSFIDLLFNKMVIVDGVTVGWVLVALMIMSILTSALLNVVSIKSINAIDNARRKEKINE